MTSPEQPAFGVHRIEDLLDLIAHQLGFHPDNSVVMVAINAGNVITAMARTNLRGSDERFDTGLRAVVTGFVAGAATRVVLVGYGRPQPVHDTLTAALQVLRTTDIRAVGAIRVTGEQYWLLTGAALRARSGAVGYRPATSAAAAAAVYDGLVALPDRDALIATLAPVTGPARERMTAATGRAVHQLAPMIAAATSGGDTGPARQTFTALLTEVERLYQAGQTADDAQAATLTVWLSVPGLRDIATRRTDSQDWRRAMWSDLLRRAEPRYAAAPACLLALCALHDGWGTLAGIAVGRALQADPGYRFAQLIGAAMAAGVAPHVITDALRGEQQ